MKESILVSLCLLLANAASATLMGSYDGSYDPASALPPAGQSTWSVTLGSQESITANSPSAGVATFLDSSTAANESIDMHRSTAGEWVNPLTTEWEFGGRFKLASNSFTPIVSATPIGGLQAAFGFRDEGGSGKSVMLAWLAYKPTETGTVSHSLRLIGYGSSGAASVHLVKTTNYWDDAWHTYKVEKKEISPNGKRLAVTIDGVLVTGALGLNYSASMPDDVTSDLGFQYLTTSGSTANIQVDNLYYVPEPATLGLLSFGVMLCWQKQRR